MLKTLAILAVLLLGCVYPAWPQIPRDGSKQDRPAQKETDSAKPAQPPPTALQVQLTPAKQEDDAKQKPSGYQWKELLAPANIPNWFLVGVGFWAGLMALRTLKAIQGQSDLMKEQSDLAKSKERARLRIEMKDVKLFRDRDFREYLIYWKLSITGTTEAYIDESVCNCCVGESDTFKRPKEWYDPMAIPQVMLPRSDVFENFSIIHDIEGFFLKDDEEIECVRQGQKSIYSFGRIVYTNAYDEQWIVVFSQQYKVLTFPDGGTLGLWRDYGPAEANREYKASNPAKPN